MKLNSKCMACQIRKQEAKIRHFNDEDRKKQYMEAIRQLHRCTEHYCFHSEHFDMPDRFSPHPRPHSAYVQGNSGLLYTAPALHCIPSFSVCD